MSLEDHIYDEDKVLSTLFNVQRFEEAVKHNLDEDFKLEDLGEIVEYYLAVDKPKNAIKALDLALDNYPLEYELYIRKADVLLSCVKNLQDPYITLIEKTLDLAALHDPNDYRILLLRAELYEFMGRYEDALAVLNSIADSLAQSDDSLQILKANVYYKMGLHAHALKFAKKALEAHSKNEEAPILIQELSIKTKNIQAGKNYLYAFIADEDPYSYAAWFALGLLYAHEKNHSRAIFCYDYALIIEGRDVEIQLCKVGSLVALDHVEEALAILKTFDTRTQLLNAQELCVVADHYRNLGLVKKARTYYRRSLVNDPTNNAALFGLALSFVDEDDQKVIKYLRLACATDTSNKDYQLLLAQSELELGNTERAISVYRLLIDQNYHTNKVWVNYLDLLWENVQSPAEIKAYLLLLERAITSLKNPSYKIYYRRTLAFFLVDAYERAKLALEEAVTLDSKYLDVFAKNLPKTILQNASRYKKWQQMIQEVRVMHRD